MRAVRHHLKRRRSGKTTLKAMQNARLDLKTCCTKIMCALCVSQCPHAAAENPSAHPCMKRTSLTCFLSVSPRDGAHVHALLHVRTPHELRVPCGVRKMVLIPMGSQTCFRELICERLSKPCCFITRTHLCECAKFMDPAHPPVATKSNNEMTSAHKLQKQPSAQTQYTKREELPNSRRMLGAISLSTQSLAARTRKLSTRSCA